MSQDQVTCPDCKAKAEENAETAMFDHLQIPFEQGAWAGQRIFERDLTDAEKDEAIAWAAIWIADGAINYGVACRAHDGSEVLAA